MSLIPTRIDVGSETFLILLEVFDAPALFSLTEYNRAHLDPWLPWVKHALSVEDSLGFIQKGVADRHDNKAFHYGIWHEGSLVGVIGAHSWLPAERFLEIGYWLGKQAEGKGLMTKSCRALIDELFRMTDLKTIQICCEPHNHRSIAVPTRLGFNLVEQVEKEQDGQKVLLNVYQMPRSSWTG